MKRKTMECGQGNLTTLIFLLLGVGAEVVMPNRYQIIVAGRIDAERSLWFDGLDIQYQDGVTILSGTIMDAQALYGIIERLRDLGLSLLEVRPLTGTGLAGEGEQP